MSKNICAFLTYAGGLQVVASWYTVLRLSCLHALVPQLWFFFFPVVWCYLSDCSYFPQSLLTLTFWWYLSTDFLPLGSDSSRTRQHPQFCAWRQSWTHTHNIIDDRVFKFQVYNRISYMKIVFKWVWKKMDCFLNDIEIIQKNNNKLVYYLNPHQNQFNTEYRFKC